MVRLINSLDLVDRKTLFFFGRRGTGGASTSESSQSEEVFGFEGLERDREGG